MTKKNFLTLVFSVTSIMLFGIGMCMCLLPEWNAFNPGVVITAMGAILLLVILLVRRKLNSKKASNPNWKMIGKIAFTVLGLLVLGFGMCMIMVWDMIFAGIAVGVIGIVLLLCYIPMWIGLK